MCMCVEMPDSCLNNPNLTAAAAPDALVRAFTQHNHLPAPAWLKQEAAEVYLGPGAASERPCRVYEDFWQDLNMQCSEDVFLDAAAAAKPRARLYSWRFTAVERCPPAISGWPGPGRGKVCDSAFHTMDLAWMFGTVSAFWSWLVPPDGASHWNCSWSPVERNFSNFLIRTWAQQATPMGVAATVWPQFSRDNHERLNLDFGNITVIRNFRRRYCDWWSSAYQRVRNVSV